jgi:hypothetical protein
MWVTVWGFAIWDRYPAMHVPLIIAVLAVFYGSMMYALIHRWIARHYRRRKAERKAAQESEGDARPVS